MNEGKGVETGFSITKLPEYFSESVTELKKVTSPTRAETIQATIVTICIMVFVAVVLFVMDMIFRRIMAALIVAG